MSGFEQPQPIHVYDVPNEFHTRYILIYPDAPAMTDVHGMINSQDDDNLLATLAFTRDGESEKVDVTLRPGDSLWVVTTFSGQVIEEIAYDNVGDVEHHATYVYGFTTDEVPTFQVGAGR